MPDTNEQNMSVPSNFPVPIPMVCHGDQVGNWEFFLQQWRDYEIATGLDKRSHKVRLATFRSIMGRDCVQVLQNLGITNENTVQEAEEALQAYFIPKRNVVYERYSFNTCCQQDNEGIEVYVNRLRKLASTCNYGAQTDEFIRDRLIIGLNSRSIKLRLLKEQGLTLDKALDTCRACEHAEKQVKAIHQQPSNESVNYVAKHRGQQTSAQGKSTRQKEKSSHGNSSKATSKSSESCLFCGNKRHAKRQDCPAYGRTCRKCGKANHFAKVCMQKSKQQVNVLNEDESDEDSEDDILVIEEISAIKGTNKRLTTKLLFQTPDNNREKIECQLDTGATCNVMSHRDLMILLQDGDPAVEKSNVSLRLFDGTIVKPVGEITLSIVRNDQQYSTKFQVVDIKSQPLICAETCKKLNLISINIEPVHAVQHIPESNGSPSLTEEYVRDHYKEVFEGLGHIGDSRFVLKPDAKPVQHTPRRLPVAIKDRVKEKLDDLENKGIIAKVPEPTEWISSMVVVTTPKKIRICLDPLDLNKAIMRPRYQMPTLEEILPQISNAKVFSTLDAKDGFYQVKLDTESSLLTTFWTPHGRYRYLRMPFGVSSAPEEFESKLHQHLDDLPGIIVLRDDILVLGKGETQAQAEKDHDNNLKDLLDRARKINLKLNSNKMCLKKAEVKFMGHVISKDGLKPDPDKVKAIEDMPKPTNKKELLTLLGFVNYLSKFLPKLSEVTQPLRELTNKEAQFIWASQHDEAFKQVKTLVIKHPVLRFYDVKKPVTIQCDASEFGLGATLLQEGHPISFASRTLSKTEKHYAQIEKECLSIVFACVKFNQYIAGREEIAVETDHKPLEFIFRKSIHAAPSRLQRMLLRLQRYNLRVSYKQGTQMYLADHLSRAPLPVIEEFHNTFEVFALEVESVNPLEAIKVSPDRLDQIQKATGQDSVLETLKSIVQQGWPETKDQVPLNIREYWNFREEITLYNGILLKNQRVIIPKVMKPEIMSRIHSSHQGIASCIRKAKDVVFWPGMSADIKEVVDKCPVCAEYQMRNSKEPMQTHKVPDRPWSRIAADLATIKGQTYLVTVDYYSDFIEVDELADSTVSAEVIKALKQHFSRHGIPDTLVTDNGPQFDCKEFRQFAREWEFEHVSSSPYHSCSNGKAESAVKVVKQLFKKSPEDPLMALLNYRNTPTEGLDTSPTQRLMSRRTRTLLPTVSTLLKPEIPTDVKTKIEKKRQNAKFYYDQKARQLPQLEIGQEVRVAPTRLNQRKWRPGTLTEVLTDRSYMVNVDNRVVRRNRQDLKASTKERNPASSSVDEELPATSSPESPLEPQPTRTRTREVKLPSKYKDFVLSK